MKARYVLGAAVAILAAPFFLGVFEKDDKLTPAPEAIVKESQIKNLSFGSSQKEVVSGLGQPSQVNDEKEIKRSVEKERALDFWRGEQRNKGKVFINLGGVSADKCLSYQTNKGSGQERWMICFKENKMFAKIKLAKKGQRSIVLQ